MVDRGARPGNSPATSQERAEATRQAAHGHGGQTPKTIPFQDHFARPPPEPVVNPFASLPASAWAPRLVQPPRPSALRN
eukprot:2615115-Alexandrium_andersonii.AAC.1